MGIGVQGARALDAGRIRARADITHRQAFGIPRFGAPDGAQLDLSGFGRAVGLLARPPLKLGGSHGDSRSVDAQVQRGRYGTVRPRLDVAPFLLGNLGSQPFGRSEEHTSELQSLAYLVCRLLLEKKKTGNSSPVAITGNAHPRNLVDHV